jgi:hypothetical protein
MNKNINLSTIIFALALMILSSCNQKPDTPALKEKKEGYTGLQYHEYDIWFRNIRIIEL